MKKEDAVLERLEAEIAAIEENIRQTEEMLLTQSGSMPWERVLSIKGHLYDLCKACEERAGGELRREARAEHNTNGNHSQLTLYIMEKVSKEQVEEAVCTVKELKTMPQN